MIELVTTDSFDEVRAMVNEAFASGTIHPLLILRQDSRFLERVRVAEAILADNDGTITSGASWIAAGKFFTDPRHTDAETAERAWYYGQHEDGEHFWHDRKPEDDADWAPAEAAWGARTIMRLAESGVTRENIGAAGKLMLPRPGVHRLFDRHRARAIITFGIADVVEGFLRAHQLPSADIAGFRLVYDDQGRVSSHHPGSCVTRACKGKAALRFLASRGIRQEHSFSVFDSVVDRRMILPGGVSLLLVPGTEANSALQRFRNMHVETLWDHGLDAILVDNDFEHLNELLDSAP